MRIKTLMKARWFLLMAMFAAVFAGNVAAINVVFLFFILTFVMSLSRIEQYYSSLEEAAYKNIEENKNNDERTRDEEVHRIPGPADDSGGEDES